MLYTELKTFPTNSMIRKLGGATTLHVADNKNVELASISIFTQQLFKRVIQLQQTRARHTLARKDTQCYSEVSHPRLLATAQKPHAAHDASRSTMDRSRNFHRRHREK